MTDFTKTSQDCIDALKEAIRLALDALADDELPAAFTILDAAINRDEDEPKIF